MLMLATLSGVRTKPHPLVGGRPGAARLIFWHSCYLRVRVGTLAKSASLVILWDFAWIFIMRQIR